MKRVLNWFRMLPSAVGLAPSYTSGMISRAAVVLCLVGLAVFGLSFVHREPVAARGGIAISHPWSKGGSVDRRSLQAYLTIENKGGQPDRLLHVESSAAQRILIKRVVRDGRNLQPVELSGLELDPQTRLVMRPGELQITLYSLNAVVQPGETVPLSLLFERAGRFDVAVQIENLGEPEHADHF